MSEPSEQHPHQGEDWSLDEYVVVADLYLRRGRSSGINDPEVVRLAELTGRSLGSISRRLGNFEGTAHPGHGLKPVTGQALAIFTAMQADGRLRDRVVRSAMTRLGANRSDVSGADRSRIVRGPRVVAPEAFRTEVSEFELDASRRISIRRESDLVSRYRAWLDPEDVRLKGMIIPTDDEDLRVDLYDTRLNVLIEAKGTLSRRAIREAIGQLLDYRRYLWPRPAIAMLLPDALQGDLPGLPLEAGVSVIWQAGSSFRDSEGGHLIAR